MRLLLALAFCTLPCPRPSTADDMVFEIPAAAAEGEPIPLTEDYLAFHQLKAPESRPEDRIVRLEAALEAQAAAEAPGWLPPRPALAGFLPVALDFAALLDPEEAIVAAHRLSGARGSQELYEELGVALLTEARKARFSDEPDLALAYLDAAVHAFDLADLDPPAEGSAAAEKAFLHRAMVRLEELAVTGAEAPWHEARDLLLRQLEATPDGPAADWAWRMLNDPAAYAGEPISEVKAAYYVGRDVAAPVKIFTPFGRYTEAARRSRIQGVVIVQAVVDRHGAVTAVRLLKGLPMGLSDEALRTLATWLFEPATRNGVPVAVYYNLTMMFRLL